MIEKPLVTVSGKKILFKSKLHQRLTQDLPQEGVEWRRRLDSNSKSVYVDVDFVDFDVDNVERASERLSRMAPNPMTPLSLSTSMAKDATAIVDNIENDSSETGLESIQVDIEEEPKISCSDFSDTEILAQKETQDPQIPVQSIESELRQQEQIQSEVAQAFFNKKLLGRPILHTYWADKTDFEGDNQKTQFDDWIGKVQASTCTEWAIIIIEDGDFKAQLGTAFFKSKLQSSTSQANASTTSIASLTQSSALGSSSTTSSFLDRMRKSLSTMFQSDSDSDRWLTLINQDRVQDNKVQESYANFLKRFRNIIMASFSKQIELFEEQLRVQREMRTGRNWNFLTYFSMQEELAFAFEFLTLFDEALVQYSLLDALFTEYISSSNFNPSNEPSYNQWTTFDSWRGLCLDMNNEHSKELRKRIVERRASLLDLRNYLFAKQCDLMLMQNQPWRVAESASIFLQNCIREHELLNIKTVPGALTCWSFISALEVLQKCECYSCTSTMENYSLHTVDIWNCARKNLLELGQLAHRMPKTNEGDEVDDSKTHEHISLLISGLGPDPHGGVSYQNNEISPQARLKDALAGREQFSKHLIEISELTLGTYKHIGRKRHALLVGKELAEFYIKQRNFTKALPFLFDIEKTLSVEKWEPLLRNIQELIKLCNDNIHEQQQSRDSKSESQD